MDKVARKVMRILNIEGISDPSLPEDDSPTRKLELIANGDFEHKIKVMTAVHILCERDSKNIDKYWNNAVHPYNENHLCAIASFEGTTEQMLKEIIMNERDGTVTQDNPYNHITLAIANEKLGEESLREVYSWFKDREFYYEDTEKEWINNAFLRNKNFPKELI